MSRTPPHGTLSQMRSAALRIGLVGAAVLAHRLANGSIRCAHQPDPAQTLVVMSWNLENFPGDHDLAKVTSRIAAIDPHVLAVQEVLDPDALATIWPDHEAHVSRRGGARGQRLGFMIDAEDSTAQPLVEHATLEHGGRVRPAASSHVQIGAIDFHLVVVHLKATPSGLEIRRTQWAALAELVARLPLGVADRDVIVIGDFNATGTIDLPAAEERAALGAVLGTVGLRPIEPEQGCSAYWDGSRHDAWLEPTLLDLAFIGGFDDADVRARALGACAVHACEPLRSTDAHPDTDVAGLSDHCPLLLEISAR